MRVVDLFAGCGGLTLGFQKRGFSIVAAYDSWEVAVDSYKANFKHPIFELDLSDTAEASEHIAQWSPDMIIGGPPCQEFSHAGKREEGRQASLTTCFADIVKSIQPHGIVMENVDRVAKSEAYREARRTFKEVGYGLTERTLDASLCGVPQKRKRFFCVGILGEEDGFLDDALDAHMSKTPISVKSYLGDELGIQYYYRHPRNYSRRGIFSTDEPSPTVRGVNRPIPKGYLGHPGDPVPVTSDLRPLTTMERARLQTFPKNFKWAGSKTDLEQMIANAVPVKLAEFIGRAVFEYLPNTGILRNEHVSNNGGLKMPKRTQLGDLENFQKWVQSERRITKRSAKDVGSRLRRANRFINVNQGLDANQLVFKMGNNAGFKELNKSIRSHLNNAVRGYVAYRQQSTH